MNVLLNVFANFWTDFCKCFLYDNMWKMYLQGLRNTLIIAAGACLLGLIIGVIVTAVRIAPKNNAVLKVLDWICRLYVTMIRGTPVVLQLFICYFVLLTGIRNLDFFGIKETSGIYVAIATFGLNSGAYMSEILRGGINSVDKGQIEAARSLGLNWVQTFIKIILPQAIRIAIPTMFNEFITLLKETSVVGFIGLMDLSKAGDFIRSRTYSAFFPLIAVAVIYLVLVSILTKIFGAIEGRLRKSDIR